MNKTNKLFFRFLIFLFLCGCKTSKEKFYAYTVDSYTIDTTKRLMSSSNVISYGSYLFEFIQRVSINNVLHGESGSVTSSIDYDTVSVYLLENKNKLYYSFDTFSLKNSILKTGKLSDKEFGVRLNPSEKDTDTTVFYGPPVEVIINKIKCFYTEVISKNKNMNDTFEMKMTMIKNANLNSLYKINGAKFTDENYCIVGLNIYLPKQRQRYIEEVDAIRPLTEKEKAICESMLIKSKAAVIDTIRGVALKEKKP
ncbi:MAG: hypothetical protein IPL54_00440 [Chitinophagaceae bacterium]|nr:hypothetical protein [Chitinophagaceae bacterium]